MQKRCRVAAKKRLILHGEIPLSKRTCVTLRRCVRVDSQKVSAPCVWKWTCSMIIHACVIPSLTVSGTQPIHTPVTSGASILLTTTLIAWLIRTRTSLIHFARSSSRSVVSLTTRSWKTWMFTSHTSGSTLAWTSVTLSWVSVRSNSLSILADASAGMIHVFIRFRACAEEVILHQSSTSSVQRLVLLDQAMKTSHLTRNWSSTLEKSSMRQLQELLPCLTLLK